MPLIQEIDERKTIVQARKVLKQYRRLSRIAGCKPLDVKSPRFTEFLKDKYFENSNEAKRKSIISASEQVSSIDEAVSRLEPECKQAIYLKYMCNSSLTNIQISNIMFGTGLSIKTAERRIRKGIMQFSESYCNGKLLVYL